MLVNDVAQDRINGDLWVVGKIILRDGGYRYTYKRTDTQKTDPHQKLKTKNIHTLADSAQICYLYRYEASTSTGNCFEVGLRSAPQSVQVKEREEREKRGRLAHTHTHTHTEKERERERGGREEELIFIFYLGVF